MIDLPIAATLRVLHPWPERTGGNLVLARLEVGLGDLRFRAEEGYAGWANGQPSEHWWEKDLAPNGAEFVFALWDHLHTPVG